MVHADLKAELGSNVLIMKMHAGGCACVCVTVLMINESDVCVRGLFCSK